MAVTPLFRISIPRKRLSSQDLLDHHHDLSDFLNQKIEAAIIHKNPYFKPLPALT